MKKKNPATAIKYILNNDKLLLLLEKNTVLQTEREEPQHMRKKINGTTRCNGLFLLNMNLQPFLM